MFSSTLRHEARPSITLNLGHLAGGSQNTVSLGHQSKDSIPPFAHPQCHLVSCGQCQTMTYLFLFNETSQILRLKAYLLLRTVSQGRKAQGHIRTSHT